MGNGKTDKSRKGVGGQPTKYDAKAHVPWAASLARRGCTDEEMAEAFGVSVRTLYRWKKAHPEFCQALNDSKSRADEAVVSSLYARATGQCVRRTVKKRQTLDPDGRKVSLIEETEDHLPPDTTAMIYWLKNRQPAMWRDKPSVEQAKSDDAAIKKWLDALGLD